MNPIGGYFELELRKGEHFHKNAIRLNAARNCFEYILRSRQYTKVYIPYYTCEVILEPLNKFGVSYEFYSINEKLEPVVVPDLKENEAFLYTNYYGLKQDCASKLVDSFENRLIVDNAQAFYAEPIQGVDTFYSARKFFGVADGAYLYTECRLDEVFEQDQSYDRMAHLLKRADVGAEYGYQDFKTNDDSLINNPIRRMSNITETILCSIDYEYCREKRIENYRYLDEHLKNSNKLRLGLCRDAVPMVYPYWSDDDSIRKKLINNRIYAATYWPNVLGWSRSIDLEYELSTHIIPLPIDQRYGEKEMKRIIDYIDNERR